jgi:hypothetical protein
MVPLAAGNNTFSTANESVKPTNLEPAHIPTQMNEELAKPSSVQKHQSEHENRNAKVNNLQTEEVINDTRMESRGNPKVFTPREDEGVTLDVGNRDQIFTPPHPFEA